jgi:hypothetical protein
VALALAAIGCEVDREALGSKAASHEIGQLAVIFNNE